MVGLTCWKDHCGRRDMEGEVGEGKASEIYMVAGLIPYQTRKSLLREIGSNRVQGSNSENSGHWLDVREG